LQCASAVMPCSSFLAADKNSDRRGVHYPALFSPGMYAQAVHINITDDQTLTPHLSMSLTFRVTTTRPWAAAGAAMSEFITGSLSPACSASP